MQSIEETVIQNERLRAEWDYDKNDTLGLFANAISVRSQQKAWWKCEYGHSWEASIRNRFYGNGCPICVRRYKTSFPEQAVFFYVKKLYPNALNGYRPEFLKGMELDIFIPDLDMGIEYDGKAWHTDKNADRDLRKYRLCQRNGVKLLRIKEETKEYTPLDTPADCILTINHVERKDNLSKLIRALLSSLDSESNIWTRKTPMQFQSRIDVDVKRDEQEIREYQRVLKEGSFQGRNPEAAKSWHPTKNGNLRPNMFHPNSSVRAWWICEQGHEWKTSFAVRSRGNGCPYCSGQKVLPGFNDLETQHPNVAKEWDYDSNGEKTQRMYTGGSGALVYWVCENGHRWESRINNRTINRRGCPYCSHEKPIIGENDLLTLYPAIAKEWHPSKNMDRNPEEYLPGSNKRVWWKCSKCGYEYRAIINNRTNKGTGCANCAGQVLQPGINDLATLYPEIVREWDCERNGDIKPSQIFPKTNKKYAWKDSLGHTWEASPNSRIRGTGCPYCSGSKVLKGFNDLATTHPEIASEWHPSANGKLLPSQVSKGYKFKVWFQCPICNNKYDSLISNKINGYGKCPYCSPRKTKARKVLQVETGKKFNTLKEAAKSVGKDDIRQIQMCCKGRCKTAYGFTWKYAEAEGTI